MSAHGTLLRFVRLWAAAQGHHARDGVRSGSGWTAARLRLSPQPDPYRPKRVRIMQVKITAKKLAGLDRRRVFR